MATREAELPGVGTKHSLELAGGDELVAVEHRAGHWELARVEANGHTTSLIQLQAREAAELGRVLSRSEVRQEDPRKRLLLEEFALEWLKLAEDSPLVGATLQSSQIRDRTGASVIAVLRAEGSILSPPPNLRIEPDDTLVVMGHRDQVEQFLSIFSTLHPED
ncbi:MAG: TrkA C-terminal domain-containing protein [Myxococcota bacterium]